MNLSSPITITPPSITKKDGTVKTFSPITLTELDVTIMDNAKRKIVLVQIRPVPRPLTLWEKEAYDAAGDYTQAQVEARVLEILGNDPAKVLEGLFAPPSKVTNK
jgi:hypothetical protein